MDMAALLTSISASNRHYSRAFIFLAICDQITCLPTITLALKTK